jgi:hypothetical protein
VWDPLWVVVDHHVVDVDGFVCIWNSEGVHVRHDLSFIIIIMCKQRNLLGVIGYNRKSDLNLDNIICVW